MAIVEPPKWQQVVCPNCNQVMDKITNAILENDVTTGGLKGVHKVCPSPKQGTLDPDNHENPENNG